MRHVGLPQLLADLSLRAAMRACVMTIAAGLSATACLGVIAVSAVEASTFRCHGSPKFEAARIDGLVLMMLAEQYILGGRLQCHDVADVLPPLPTRLKYDPWDVAYTLGCLDGVIVACSAGADRQHGTLDDICTDELD